MRVTLISPGFARTDFTDMVPNAQVKAQLTKSRDRLAIAPEAIARAMAFATSNPTTST